MRMCIVSIFCVIVWLCPCGVVASPSSSYERSKQTAQTTITDGTSTHIYWVAEAQFGPRLPQYDDALQGTVVAPRNVKGETDLKACHQTPVSQYAQGQILFAERGNCTFEKKSKHAKLAGAKAIIIVNSVQAMYDAEVTNQTQPDAKKVPVSKLHTGVCDYDCTKGEAYIDSNKITRENAYAGFQCGSRSSCPSQTCVLTKASVEQTQQRQVCCIADDLIRMSSSGDISRNELVPAVFTKIGNSRELYDAIRTGSSAKIEVSQRWVPVVEPAGVFLFLFAVSTLGVATWRASAPDRDMMERQSDRIKDPATGIEVLDEGNIPLWSIACILVSSAAVLVLLYVLIQYGVGVVIFIQCLFILTGTTSWALLVFKPIFDKLTPRMKDKVKIWCFSETTKSHVAGLPVGLGLMLVWFFFRFENWSWIIQNATGVVLITLILLQIRLPSLRFISTLLWAFFLYDIFMVFITPFLVGDSVMVEVATAGQPKPVPNWECHCRLNPDDKRHCGKDDFLPILFRIPTLLDYRRGDSMLGFGDLVIPGILLAYVTRFSVWKGRKLTPLFKSTSYFTWLLIGYAVGLIMANVAIILTGLGQPVRL